MKPRRARPAGRARLLGLRCLWLEHDHGGFGWAPRGVGVEVVVDLGPAGPQPLALVSLGTARTDLPCSVAGSGDGLRMSLQVQPPGGFGRTPPVHRHRDQVGSVLEVADDDLPRPPGAPADRGEPQRPPAAGLGPPQTHPAARHAQQRAMAVPEQPDEPPRRQPGPPAMRSRCPRLTTPGHNSSMKTRRDPPTRAEGHRLSGPSAGNRPTIVRDDALFCRGKGVVVGYRPGRNRGEPGFGVEGDHRSVGDQHAGGTRTDSPAKPAQPVGCHAGQ
jgi:hypothetical protein